MEQVTQYFEEMLSLVGNSATELNTRTITLFHLVNSTAMLVLLNCSTDGGSLKGFGFEVQGGADITNHIITLCQEHNIPFNYSPLPLPQPPQSTNPISDDDDDNPINE